MLQTVGEQVKTVDNCFYEAKFPKQGVAEVSYACDRYNYAARRDKLDSASDPHTALRYLASRGDFTTPLFTEERLLLCSPEQQTLKVRHNVTTCFII